MIRARGRVFAPRLGAVAAAVVVAAAGAVVAACGAGHDAPGAPPAEAGAPATLDAGSAPPSPPDAGAPCTTDVASDTKNCGRCGHDCLGGPCSEGRCQPAFVTGGVTNAASIVVDARFVYVTSSQARVLRVPIGGGAPEVVYDGSDIIALAVDDAHLFAVTYACGTPATVLRIQKDAAPDAGVESAISVADDETCGVLYPPAATAGSDLFVVAEQGGGSTFRVVRVADGGATPVTPSMPDTFPSIAAAPGVVDFCDGDAVWTVPADQTVAEDAGADAGAAVVLARGGCGAIAVGDGGVFFSDTRGGVRRADAAHGEGELLATGQDATQMVADETNVYWVASSADQLVACPLSGCAEGPRVLASGYGGINGLAADATTLYFTTASGGIWRVAK